MKTYNLTALGRNEIKGLKLTQEQVEAMIGNQAVERLEEVMASGKVKVLKGLDSLEKDSLHKFVVKI